MNTILAIRWAALASSVRHSLSGFASWRRYPNWLFVLMLGVAGGCATFDPANVATRPWNRPTKEEISQHWWFGPDCSPGFPQSWLRDHYP